MLPRMTEDEILEVVQAKKAGHDIECRPRNHCGLGWSVAIPMWNFQDYRYRVKPQPLEAYANTYPRSYPRFHHTRTLADKSASSDRIACVRLVEAERWED